MRSPKAQPKRKTKAKTPHARAVPSIRSTNLGGFAPAYIRLPSHPVPFADCPPINHPRGKDGGWGH